MLPFGNNLTKIW